MEKTVTTTECDICSNTYDGSYESALNHGWNKLQYKQDWSSGSHRGDSLYHMVVCPKCLTGKGLKYYFYLLKIKTNNKLKDILKDKV